MGTSLFNTTPAATYPALIKVGNNTSIDGTLKVLSDGAGNDLPLQVSSTVTNFTGNVGINTTTPTQKLDVNGVSRFRDTLNIDNNKGLGFSYSGGTSGFSILNSSSNQFQINNGNYGYNLITIPDSASSTAAVGIGTTSPTAKLQVKGNGSTSATTSLLVQNSTPSTLFSIADNGNITQSVGSATIYNGLTVQFAGIQLNNNGSFNTGGNLVGSGASCQIGQLQILSTGNAGATGLGISTPESTMVFQGYTLGPTGIGSMFTFRKYDSATVPLNTISSGLLKITSIGFNSGNANNLSANTLWIEPTYNFSNASITGTTVRGIYYNPTLTSLTNTTHIALETVTGNVLLGTTSGNVGIGTSSPANKLSIKQVDSNTSILRLDSASSVGSNTYEVGVDFYSRITGAGGTDSYPVGKMYATGGSEFRSGKLRFQTIITNGGSLTDTMTLYQGNVGIGSLNTTPSTLLQVTGLKDTVVADFSSNTVAPNEGVSIQLSAQAGIVPLGVIRGLFLNYGGYSGLTFSTTNANTLTEAIRINSSQQVGIGTTAPTARLQVKGSGTTSGTTAFLVENSTPSTLFSVTDNGAIVCGISGQGSVQLGTLNLSYPATISYPSAYGLTISPSTAGSGVISVDGSSMRFLAINNGITYTQPTAKSFLIKKEQGGADATSFFNIAGADQTDAGQAGAGGVVRIFGGLNNGIAAQGLLVLAHNGTTTQGSVVVGGTSANASALMDIQSTTKGFLPPRMTTAERVAITSPADGLIVFDTTVQNLCYRRDSTWVQVSFTAV